MTAIRLLLTEFKMNTLLHFNKVLVITLGLLVIQLTLVYFKHTIYIDLFIAPLLYFFVSKPSDPLGLPIKFKLLHFSFLVVLSLLFFISDTEFYLLAIFFYLMIYVFLIHKKLKRSLGKGHLHSSNLFVSFCVFYLCVSSFLCLIQFVDIEFLKGFDFNYQFVFSGLLLTMICFSVYLLCSESKFLDAVSGISEISCNKKEAVSMNVTPDRAVVVVRIKSFFENSDLYLHANFTMEDLSVVLGTPRSVLTDVMNKEMTKGFYAILGEYRINYAKKILLTQENFTIEALVQQCGFHSKSTFNKYFKEFVGQTPSSFRNEHMVNIKVL